MPDSVYDACNNPITNPQEIANKFVEHFENVPNKSRSKVKSSKKHYLDYMDKVPVCKKNYTVLHNASIEDIYSLIKSNRSPGPLQIPNYFLKMISHKLAPPLTNAINKSLECGPKYT